MVLRFLIAVASLVLEHGLQRMGSVTFLDQGSNQYPLHQQADSYPLDHQGSPVLGLLDSVLKQMS